MVIRHHVSDDGLLVRVVHADICNAEKTSFSSVLSGLPPSSRNTLEQLSPTEQVSVSIFCTCESCHHCTDYKADEVKPSHCLFHCINIHKGLLLLQLGHTVLRDMSPSLEGPRQPTQKYMQNQYREMKNIVRIQLEFLAM